MSDITPELLTIAHDVRLAAQRLSRHVKDHTPSLAPHLFVVLVHLEHRSATAAELAAAERLSAPTMSKTVCELEERGLVRRELNPADARQKIVSLTSAGRQAIVRGRRERDAYMAERLGPCTPDELSLLRGGLPHC